MIKTVLSRQTRKINLVEKEPIQSLGFEFISGFTNIFQSIYV